MTGVQTCALPICGTLEVKGAPGNDNTQLLSTSIRNCTSTSYGSSSDGYLVFTQNSANSIAWNVQSLSATANTSSIYVQGLSGSVTLNLRSVTAANGILYAGSASTNTGAFLVGSSGTGDFINGIVGNVTAYSGYAGALPTSGGVATSNYTLSGGTTLVGNLSTFAIKATTATAADTLDLSTFSLTNTTLLITGNNAGAFTINGTFGGAVGLGSRTIANVSTSEVRIVAPLTIAAAPILTGRGTISLGSPTITYRSNAGYLQSIYAIGTEIRIYAGSDNLTPSLTTGSL